MAPFEWRFACGRQWPAIKCPLGSNFLSIWCRIPVRPALWGVIAVTLFEVLLAAATCADQESFVRGGGSNFDGSFSLWGGEDPNTTISGPSKWRFAGGPMMAGSFVIFRGSRLVLLRNPIFFRFFRGGGSGIPVPLWIRTWTSSIYWLMPNIFIPTC